MMISVTINSEELEWLCDWYKSELFLWSDRKRADLHSFLALFDMTRTFLIDNDYRVVVVFPSELDKGHFKVVMEKTVKDQIFHIPVELSV